MAAETVVYTPENGGANNMFPWMATMLQNRGIDPNVLYSIMGNNRGGWFGNDMFSSLIALIVVCGIFGNNGFGGLFGGGNSQGTAALGNLINNNDGRELLMQAIQGNRTAISELAGTLNVSISAVQQSLNGVSRDIQSVGNQVGMSGMQIINAIQSGNCQLGNQIAQGLCGINNSITQQGYENRLATLQQTDALSAKIAEQTTMINDKFCQLEMRELQGKLAASQLENANLRGEISQGQQNAYITGFVGQALAPINAQLAALNKEVDDIKCKQPNTVNVPYPNLVAMQQGTALNLLASAGYGYGNGIGGGFFGQNF